MRQLFDDPVGRAGEVDKHSWAGGVQLRIAYRLSRRAIPHHLWHDCILGKAFPKPKLARLRDEIQAAPGSKPPWFPSQDQRPP